MYHIISYIDITYLHHNNTQHVSFLLSFIIHLFYYTFSLSGFSSLFLSVLLVSLYTIISTISQSLFPGSCFSSLILCSFAKAFSIIFFSIKLDCSIFYSIHYLRLYTLTIYIYIYYIYMDHPFRSFHLHLIFSLRSKSLLLEMPATNLILDCATNLV